MCYVDPRDPREAVLQRGWPTELWFGAIPLVFGMFGLVGLGYMLRSEKETPGSLRGSAPPNDTGGWGAGPDATGQVLKPASPRWVKLVLLLFFAFFWCGITSVFVTVAVRSWSTSSPEYFLSVFIVPFVLVGLGLLGAIPYQFLALWNPQVELTLSSGQIALGDEVRVSWSITGKAERIRSLRMRLRATESATYRRGTTTSTDRHVFLDRTLAEATDLETIRRGTTRLVVPRDSMHTFKASNNQIAWTLVVEGDIPRWPDISDEFSLTVQPQRPDHG